MTCKITGQPIAKLCITINSGVLQHTVVPNLIFIN